MKELNNKYAALPLLNFTENKINLVHNENSISVVSEIVAINNNPQSVKETIFKLNPGLEISRVTANGNEIDFTREEHLIVLYYTHVLFQMVYL